MRGVSRRRLPVGYVNEAFKLLADWLQSSFFNSSRPLNLHRTVHPAYFKTVDQTLNQVLEFVKAYVLRLVDPDNPQQRASTLDDIPVSERHVA